MLVSCIRYREARMELWIACKPPTQLIQKRVSSQREKGGRGGKVEAEADEHRIPGLTAGTTAQDHPHWARHRTGIFIWGASGAAPHPRATSHLPAC